MGNRLVVLGSLRTTSVSQITLRESLNKFLWILIAVIQAQDYTYKTYRYNSPPIIIPTGAFKASNAQYHEVIPEAGGAYYINDTKIGGFVTNSAFELFIYGIY